MTAEVVWSAGQHPTRREVLADVLAALAFHLRYRLIGVHA